MDIVALSNGLYGSISVDWVAPPLWNIHSSDIGGNLPIVIMKKDGFVTIMPEYITMCHGGKELRQFKIE